MKGALIPLVIVLAGAAEPGADEGTIRGLVVNASRGGAPGGEAEVVLRVRIDGQFVPAATTVADERGRFEFAPLPLGEEYLYLPGANHQEVHYPGPRIRLTRAGPFAEVKLKVHDAVREPSPLVIKRQDILIEPTAGALRVTESLLIDNPTSKTYVGRSAGEEEEPITLALSIPPDFERTSFHQEFFGRNFRVAGQQVVTGIPWTPGERELAFTYVLGNDERFRLWQRPLDLPCRDLRVRIRHGKPDEVACNLEPASGVDAGEIAFQSRGRTLPAGHAIRVELGRLPIPWTSYARWTAAVLLLALLVIAAALAVPRRRSASPREPSASAPASRAGKSARRGRRSRRAA